METLNDIDLIGKIRAGESRALESLVSRHYQAVFRLAYRFCGLRQDAEDIAQEVFVKLARNLADFKGGSSFTTWLYRITVNAAKDHRRGIAARKVHEAAYLAERKALAETGSHHNPVSPEQVYAAVAKLPPKYQEAVLLVFAEGLSHKETADILNCAETTVSWRIFQARRKLKKLLNQELSI